MADNYINCSDCMPQLRMLLYNQTYKKHILRCNCFVLKFDKNIIFLLEKLSKFRYAVCYEQAKIDRITVVFELND